MTSHIASKLFDEIIKKVRENPDADLSAEMQVLIEKMDKIKDREQTLLFSSFILILFDFDYERCLRTLTKCVTLDPQDLKPTPSEAGKLLGNLWFVIRQYYSQNDFSKVINDISNKYLMQQDSIEVGEELPFV